MIKFFPKIRQKLFTENKFSKYLLYAIGEIILVMIGILLALQVNNLNQERLNAIEEQFILQDISNELQAYKFHNNNGRNLQENILSATKRLLIIINTSPSNLPIMQINEDIDLLLRSWMTGSSTSTNIYDVLIGGGKLVLLSSKKLPNKLAELKRHFGSIYTREMMQARFVNEQLAPFLNQYVVRRPWKSTDLSVDSTFQTNRFVSNYEDLLNSQEFYNLLVDLIRHSNYVVRVYNRIENNINEIELELGENIISF